MNSVTRAFVLELLARFRAGDEIRFDDNLVTSVAIKDNGILKLDFVFGAPIELYVNFELAGFVTLVKRFEVEEK